MSQANVETVRRAHEAFAAGGPEATLPFFASDLLLYAYPEWPGAAEYRGYEGLLAVLAAWTENFDAFELEFLGRIKGSSVPIRHPLGAVYSEFRDGRIGEARTFLTWREAREVGGLSE